MRAFEDPCGETEKGLHYRKTTGATEHTLPCDQRWHKSSILIVGERNSTKFHKNKRITSDPPPTLALYFFSWTHKCQVVNCWGFCFPFYKPENNKTLFCIEITICTILK
jgi:hypothetical protein